ncbi:MAG: hypothetical protein C4K58_07415 [Flavobacteriaceae bacterium]|nr:MAG: hypothetical protein C4K58_07415 [Flavobacteriaceae bacterium]
MVLFDSIEDAAFESVQENKEYTGIDHYISLIKNGNEKGLLEKLNQMSVRLVFTAHPTQFYPPEVLGIIENIREYTQSNNIEELDKTLQQLGLTSFVNKDKPTPVEEAANIIYYLREVYYQSICDFYQKLQFQLGKKFSLDNLNLVKIGFWPGGDRDGNPFVTAKVTKEVADLLRVSLLKNYYNDLKKLEKKLTFRELLSPMESLKKLLYQSMFDAKIIPKSEDILSLLLDIKKILIEEYHSLYLEDLEELILKVQLFKTHFATLDIRQNHQVHHRVVEEILKQKNIIKSGLEHYSEKEIITFLENDFLLSPEDFQDPLVKETLETILVIPKIQEKNGTASLERYIISNSEDIFSVLYVLALFRWVGINPNHTQIDIVPLFETMLGMEHSGEIMQTFLFKKQIAPLSQTLFLFDTLGIGLFTLLGLQKGLDFGLHPFVAITMGISSAVMGGVIRDVLTAEVPLIFKKEIYASACFVGGLVYLLALKLNLNPKGAFVLGFVVIVTIRLLAVKHKLQLPKIK